MHAILTLFKMLKFCRCHSTISLRNSINPCFGVFPAFHFLSQLFLAWSCDQGIEFQINNSTLYCFSIIPSLIDFIFFTPMSPLSFSSGQCRQSTDRFLMTSPTLVFPEHSAISSVSSSRGPISSADVTFSQDPAYLLPSISSHSSLFLPHYLFSVYASPPLNCINLFTQSQHLALGIFQVIRL